MMRVDLATVDFPEEDKDIEVTVRGANLPARWRFLIDAFGEVCLSVEKVNRPSRGVWDDDFAGLLPHAFRRPA